MILMLKQNIGVERYSRQHTKIKKTGIIVVLITIICIQFLSLTAQAHTEEGAMDIDGGHYKVYSVVFSTGDKLVLNYSIYVQSGPPINIYLVNSNNYGKFINGDTFNYYSKGSAEYTVGITTGNITLTTHDTYYIIVDNTGNMDPVTVIYDITYNIYEVTSSSGGGNTSAIIGGIVGVIISAIVIVIVFIGMKKKRNVPLPTQHSESIRTEEKTKFCPQCGREIPSDATVCPYCGCKLTE